MRNSFHLSAVLLPRPPQIPIKKILLHDFCTFTQSTKDMWNCNMPVRTWASADRCKSSSPKLGSEMSWIIDVGQAVSDGFTDDHGHRSMTYFLGLDFGQFSLRTIWLWVKTVTKRYPNATHVIAGQWMVIPPVIYDI